MEIQKEAEERAVALKAEVDALVVIDQASYDYADAISAKANDALKKIDASCDPVIKAAHDAHKAALAQKKTLRDPIEAVKKAIDTKMIAWYKAEQARIAEERRKAEEEARKKAEEEALAKAAALEAEGLTAAAAQVLESPIAVEKVDIPDIEKGAGVSYRESWSAEVSDLMTLVKAIAEGKTPLYYVEASMTALNGAMRESKGQAVIPGVKAVSSTSQVRR